MTGVSKAAIAALCVNLAASCPALADGAAAQSDADRLHSLLETIDQQSQKLEQQQADIERQRSELEKEKVELMKLKASIAGSIRIPTVAQATKTPSPGTSAHADQTAHAEIVRTRYGYLPVPREAPRDDAGNSIASSTPAGNAVDASAADSASASSVASLAAAKTSLGSRLVGSTAKNDLGIPAPQREAVADNSSPYDSEGNIHVHTLKDLVRSAIAPTLAGQSDSQSEVGEKPKKETPAIDIAVLADRGGVLTPRGTLVITPAVEYSHSSVERFFFDGVELVEAIHIGNLLAESVDRDSVTSSFALRYGLTRRLEIDAQVPFLYRDDRTLNKVLDVTNKFPDSLTALRGDGVGDVEFGAHYQLNKPKGPYPYFVAGIRAKSPTGNGPFDVPYDLQKGLPKQLPTGSGFWTVEPQLTMIYPSDPVVLFANVGYQYTFSQNVNKIILDTLANPNASTNTQEETRTTVTNVQPGGTLDIGLGMGIGLNDSVSMSIGYQHSWIMGSNTHTRQDLLLHDLVSSGTSLETQTFGVSPSQDAQLGELLIGASVAVDDHVGLNFNVGIGVTNNAPDVTVTFRTPLSWRVFH